MLKIIKDVTIRHNGVEIHCKAGQIVNVKASFDINDDIANGVEIRNADKFRLFVKRIIPKDKSKAVTLEPSNIHNSVEQKRREKDKLINEGVDETEEEEEEEEESDSQEEDKSGDGKDSSKEKKGKGGK